MEGFGFQPPQAPRRPLRGPIKRFLAYLYLPQRRNSKAFARWALPRISVVVLLTLLVLDFILPIVGNHYLPSRRQSRPIAPDGLALVDTLPSSRPRAVE